MSLHFDNDVSIFFDINFTGGIISKRVIDLVVVEGFL